MCGKYFGIILHEYHAMIKKNIIDLRLLAWNGHKHEKDKLYV